MKNKVFGNLWKIARKLRHLVKADPAFRNVLLARHTLQSLILLESLVTGTNWKTISALL